MIKIIVDIFDIYTGNMLEIKDWIMAFESIGIDAVTIDIHNEIESKRITKRELYILKSFCDFVKINCVPIIRHYFDPYLCEELEINDSIGYEGGNYDIIIGKNSYFLFNANSVPVNFPTFGYLHYIGMVDGIDGINASIVAICKGAQIIVKKIKDEDINSIGAVSIDELKKLCIFRDSYKKLIGI